jgi:hypothetical protein
MANSNFQATEAAEITAMVRTITGEGNLDGSRSIAAILNLR